MRQQANRLIIKHIKIGFSGIVSDGNFVDCHRELYPFGTKWGRGVLVKGKDYLEAITGPYGCSHSSLKNGLEEDEESRGTFYFGYDSGSMTLYFEYACDRTFDFEDDGVLDAIMDALKRGAGPLKDFILGKVG